MSSESRFRQRGGFANRVAIKNVYRMNDGAFIGTDISQATAGQLETMTDRVNKPFIPGKTFVNAPMSKTHRIQDRTPVSGSRRLYNNPTDPGPGLITGERYIDRSSALAALSSRLSNIDSTSLISEAATSALAGVRKPEVAGLVAIKEIRETVNSLIHPVDGALKFLKRNALGYRKDKALSRRNLKKSASDIADQHLTIVFGLMPFISDVQGTLKVLREMSEEPKVQVLTSRGSASSMDIVTQSVDSVLIDDGNNLETLHCDDECRRTVSVRAYLLYRTKVDIADALGLSPSEIPRALWQTLPLSFVVDWFGNVSNYISALTPRFDVEHLASGYTISTVDSYNSLYSTKCIYRRTAGWAGSESGGVHTDLILNKTRVPTSLYPLIGLHLKHNMHKSVLDTFKVTAAISLLTQRLQKLL